MTGVQTCALPISTSLILLSVNLAVLIVGITISYFSHPKGPNIYKANKIKEQLALVPDKEQEIQEHHNGLARAAQAGLKSLVTLLNESNMYWRSKVSSMPVRQAKWFPAFELPPIPKELMPPLQVAPIPVGEPESQALAMAELDEKRNEGGVQHEVA